MESHTFFKTYESNKKSEAERNENGSVLIQSHEVKQIFSKQIDGKKEVFVSIDFSYLREKYPNSFLDFSKPFLYRVGSFGTLWTLDERTGKPKSASCFRLVTNKVKQVFCKDLESLGINPYKK